LIVAVDVLVEALYEARHLRRVGALETIWKRAVSVNCCSRSA
jgi:hypothetical protein